jgi:hypothetical protein
MPKDPNPYSTEGIDPKIKYNKSNSPTTSTNSDGRAVGSGFFHDPLFEAVPKRINTPSEHVISGRNNTWIVLGRDRPASLGSGYGATGINNAGAIDICVGMMAGSKTGAQQISNVHPNMASDAARIYISAKTDIDENFGLADGKQQKLKEGSTKGKSGIGIKADGVRIVARANGIKLITGKGNFNNTGANGEVDSTGNILVPNDLGAIELIAGNDTTDIALSEIIPEPLLAIIKTFFPTPLPDKIKKLQPMVKGDNLVLCFQFLLDIIENLMIKINVLTGVVTEFMVAVPPALIPLPGAAALATASAYNAYRLMTEVSLGTNPTGGSMKQQIDKVDEIYLKPQGQFYINSRQCRLT